MYQIMKNVIDRGGFDLARILAKLDTLWAQDQITQEEWDELAALAREKAKAGESVDILAKLAELEARVKELEGGGSILPSAEEYIPGKWYYNGDVCLWNGDTYACVAAEGTPCVWSPSDYPAYWARVEA